MVSGMQNDEIVKLRNEVLTVRAKRRGPFPADLRARLSAYVRRERAGGRSIEELAKELGLCSKTVREWLRAKETTFSLRKVRVVKEVTASSVRSMHGPLGTRVDGISLEDICELWRRLS